jgi:tetratricopeptide (TPR) repeat protein
MKHKFLISILCLGFFVISCKKDKKTTTSNNNGDIKLIPIKTDTYAKYKKLLGKREFSKVIELANEEIKKTPKANEPYYYAGVAYFNMRKLNKAKEHFEKSIETGGNFADLYINYSETLFYLGNLEKCESVLKDAMVKFPKAAGLWYNMAGIYTAKGDFENAIKQHKEALVINPKYGLSLITLGEIYFKQKKFEESKKYFTKASNIKGFEGKAFLRFGYVLIVEKKYEEALKSFDKAMKFIPKNSLLNRFRQGVLLKLGKLDIVKIEMNEKIKKDPTRIDYKINLARILVKYGKGDEGTKSVLEILNKLKIQTPKSLYLKIAVYLKMKKCIQSKETYEIFEKNHADHKLLSKAKSSIIQFCKEKVFKCKTGKKCRGYK